LDTNDRNKVREARSLARESHNPDHLNSTVTNSSPPAVKIDLFRSLFRGREDVYPRRFESRKTGKSGYAPACANEWTRGVCEKPRIKCTDCPNRRFLQVTDEVIGCHLSGRDGRGSDFVMGVYAIRAGQLLKIEVLDHIVLGAKGPLHNKRMSKGCVSGHRSEAQFLQ
jgi:hypothetical protein